MHTVNYILTKAYIKYVCVHVCKKTGRKVDKKTGRKAGPLRNNLGPLSMDKQKTYT